MPSNDTDYIELLNRSILTLFGAALKLVLAKPPLAVFFLRTMNYQRKARDRREKMEKEGVHVPPFMIVSVTDLCNLKCKGCYNQTLRPKKEKEMAPEKFPIGRAVERAVAVEDSEAISPVTLNITAVRMVG